MVTSLTFPLTSLEGDEAHAPAPHTHMGSLWPQEVFISQLRKVYHCISVNKSSPLDQEPPPSRTTSPPFLSEAWQDARSIGVATIKQGSSLAASVSPADQGSGHRGGHKSV